MLNLKGSNKTIELIEYLQKENGKHDSKYVPKAFHKPDKSFTRRLWNFVNPFSHPAELKK